MDYLVKHDVFFRIMENPPEKWLVRSDKNGGKRKMLRSMVGFQVGNDPKTFRRWTVHSVSP
jgi:hypothetical protein